MPDGRLVAWSEREELLHDLAEHARLYASFTTIGVPRSLVEQAAATGAAASAPASAESAPQSAAPATRESEDASAAAAAAAALAAIREEIGDCQRCKLAKGRKNIVFGQGDPRARLMFVGEAPGADEDEQGLAFVGKAGQLLTRIIEAMGLKREDVFIANVLKCRPPQNRNPEPDEILACQPFLEAQIDSIKPKVIVGLGKFGAQYLLKTMEPITRLRGRLGTYRGITVMPTYHPAYLLRNPSGKKEVWEDMKVVMEILDAAP
jgi:DNA polymerase